MPRSPSVGRAAITRAGRLTACGRLGAASCVLPLDGRRPRRAAAGRPQRALRRRAVRSRPCGRACYGRPCLAARWPAHLAPLPLWWSLSLFSRLTSHRLHHHGSARLGYSSLSLSLPSSHLGHARRRRRRLPPPPRAIPPPPDRPRPPIARGQHAPPSLNPPPPPLPSPPYRLRLSPPPRSSGLVAAAPPPDLCALVVPLQVDAFEFVFIVIIVCYYSVPLF